MTRHEKLKEIYKKAKELDINMSTLVFLLATKTDKGLTKFYNEFMLMK